MRRKRTTYMYTSISSAFGTFVLGEVLLALLPETEVPQSCHCRRRRNWSPISLCLLHHCKISSCSDLSSSSNSLWECKGDNLDKSSSSLLHTGTGTLAHHYLSSLHSLCLSHHCHSLHLTVSNMILFKMVTLRRK